MLDKTQESDVQAELAIGIQLATTIGGQRTLSFSAGVPMDWTADQINKTLDKLVAASDRQKARFDLTQTKQLLANEEQNLHLHRAQRATQELTYKTSHQLGNRNGDWKPTGSQKSVLDGLDKNVETSTERILKLRETIEKMENECR